MLVWFPLWFVSSLNKLQNLYPTVKPDKTAVFILKYLNIICYVWQVVLKKKQFRGNKNLAS